VKAVVIDRNDHAILWHDYQRHHTKQPEKVLELMEAIIGFALNDEVGRDGFNLEEAVGIELGNAEKALAAAP